MVLPSKLVVVFTPNTQSLTGIEELIRKAVHYRLKSADERPLQVFPLPSRIPIDRPRLYQTWRYGGTTESSTVAIRGYQRVFEAVFAEVYDFTSLQNQFEDYFNQAQLQQISDYAYGEPIAVELEKDESRLSIRASYEAFLELLLELDGPWESLQDKRDTAAVRLRVEELHKALQEGAEDTALRFAYALLDQPWTESSLEEGLEAVVEVARKRALSTVRSKYVAGLT